MSLRLQRALEGDVVPRDVSGGARVDVLCQPPVGVGVVDDLHDVALDEGHVAVLGALIVVQRHHDASLLRRALRVLPAWRDKIVTEAR